MIIAYVAAPFGGKHDNLVRAMHWVRYLNRKHWPDIVFIAPWAGWVGAVPETPENIAIGMELNKADIARCGALYAVGGGKSVGRAAEIEHALSCGIYVDLTYINTESPPDA